MEEKIAQLEANVTLLNEGNTQKHGIIESLTTSAMQNNSDMADMTTKMRSLEQWMLKYEHNYKVMKQQIEFLKDALEETKKRKREDDVADGLPESAE